MKRKPAIQRRSTKQKASKGTPEMSVAGALDSTGIPLSPMAFAALAIDHARLLGRAGVDLPATLALLSKVDEFLKQPSAVVLRERLDSATLAELDEAMKEDDPQTLKLSDKLDSDDLEAAAAAKARVAAVEKARVEIKRPDKFPVKLRPALTLITGERDKARRDKLLANADWARFSKLKNVDERTFDRLVERIAPHVPRWNSALRQRRKPAKPPQDPDTGMFVEPSVKRRPDGTVAEIRRRGDSGEIVAPGKKGSGV